MEMMEGLMTRRSVRKYTDQKIDKATLTEIIRAAQYAPTAHNRQPWEFLVVDDREVLANLRHIQRWTSFAKDAACVVFVLGDVSQSFNRDKENEKWSFVDVDCAIATENLMLAAWAKGIGTCYCGAAPMQRVVDDLKEYLKLPDNIRPFAIVTMGYPAETPKQPEGIKACIRFELEFNTRPLGAKLYLKDDGLRDLKLRAVRVIAGSIDNTCTHEDAAQ